MKYSAQLKLTSARQLLIYYYYNSSCIASLLVRLITSLPSLLEKKIASEMLQRMQTQIHSRESLIPYMLAHTDVVVIAVLVSQYIGPKICLFHKL